MATPEREALRLIGDVYGLLEIEEFRVGLLEALSDAVPSDWASLNEVGPDPAETFSIVEPPLGASSLEVWKQHAHENPLVAHVARTRDGRPLRFSDLISSDELHELPLHRELYAPIGLEYQIAFTLPAPSDMIVGVALSRRDHDFSDAEQELLELARPHLIQAYNNAMRHSRVLRAQADRLRPLQPQPAQLVTLGLTGREAEVVHLTSIGRSDREIAELLQISHRTVQKHLQRCYAKLGVRDRSQAAAIVLAHVD